jgi:hypothetical protein
MPKNCKNHFEKFRRRTQLSFRYRPKGLTDGENKSTLGFIAIGLNDLTALQRSR